MRLVSTLNRNRLPGIVWVVLSFTLLAVSVPGNILGFNISGLAWALPLMYSLLILVRRVQFVSFPFGIWVPWGLLLIVYLVLSDTVQLDPRVNPLQRSVQLVCPLVVGMAASTFLISCEVLEKLINMLRLYAYLLFFLATVGSLSLMMAGLPTGLAAQVMTACILAIVFITRFLAMKMVRDLWGYLMMVVLSIISVTRTVIAVMLLMVPLTFVPLGLLRRLGILIMGLLVAIWTFYLPQIQRKMFFSGHGDITSLSFDNPDLATSGRSYMWRVLYAIANQRPWFGHGTGSAETLTYAFTPVGYPHNDWLLTYVDYGVIGVLVFLMSNAAMMIHCYLSSKKTKNQITRIFFLAGASSFIPFMVIMFTDNIMVYASFFGNIQYLIIGLAYGALNYEGKVRNL